MLKENLVQLFEESFKKNWVKPALRNYSSGSELSYGELAETIAAYHLFYKEIGIAEGDPIAVSGKNSISWTMAYMSALTYGAVVVPILEEFHPRDITHILNHSNSKLLFCDNDIWKKMDSNDFKQLVGVISLNDDAVIDSRIADLDQKFANRSQLVKAAYKDGFTAEHVSYSVRDENELAVLCYTSGTTSMTKGVMLSYRNIWENVSYASMIFRNRNVDLKSTLCVLPLAHTYGTTFTLLLQLEYGAKITFLGRVPTPTLLVDACKDVKPTLLLLVPLVLEKIYKNKIVPQLQKPIMKKLLTLPFIGDKLYQIIGSKVKKTLGGALFEVILGGAAIDKEVESFFVKSKFPFLVGYGMTECGPLISYVPHEEFKLGSVGRILTTMDIRIVPEKEGEEVGEIQVKGPNVMLGYYKDEEATAATFTEDGWLKTGDLGIVDAEGNIFIMGRSKTMLLGSSGENIYPEPIESKLSNLPFVSECLIFERNKKIEAWVYPDMEAKQRLNISDEKLVEIMNSNRKTLNSVLAKFEAIHAIKISPEPFLKTPKQTPKRLATQQMLSKYFD